jgi:hypothetical protein
MTKLRAQLATGLRYIVSTSFVLGASVTCADAVTLAASDITGLRKGPGETVFLLDFQAVKGLDFDRTVAHFDVTSLKAVPPLASLSIPLQNIDAGGADGTFDATHSQAMVSSAWTSGIPEL